MWMQYIRYTVKYLMYTVKERGRSRVLFDQTMFRLAIKKNPPGLSIDS